MWLNIERKEYQHDNTYMLIKVQKFQDIYIHHFSIHSSDHHLFTLHILLICIETVLDSSYIYLYFRYFPVDFIKDHIIDRYANRGMYIVSYQPTRAIRTVRGRRCLGRSGLQYTQFVFSICKSTALYQFNRFGCDALRQLCNTSWNKLQSAAPSPRG